MPEADHQERTIQGILIITHIQDQNLEERIPGNVTSVVSQATSRDTATNTKSNKELLETKMKTDLNRRITTLARRKRQQLLQRNKKIVLQMGNFSQSQKGIPAENGF